MRHCQSGLRFITTEGGGCLHGSRLSQRTAQDNSTSSFDDVGFDRRGEAGLMLHSGLLVERS